MEIEKWKHHSLSAPQFHPLLAALLFLLCDLCFLQISTIGSKTWTGWTRFRNFFVMLLFKS